MIEIHNVECVIKSLSDKPLEPKDGQKLKLETQGKIELRGVPEHLDQFLDTTQAGTKPSAVLWSGGRQGAEDKNKFVRWLGMLETKFQLNHELDYMLKLAAYPAKEAPADAPRREVVIPIRFKGKGVYELRANGVNIGLPWVADIPDEVYEQLRELRREEKLDGSVYQRQADLVQEPTQPPRPDSGKVVVGEFGKGKKGAEKPRKGGKKDKGLTDPAVVGAEDALFPSVVEHVVKTRKATIPDLQLAFKITEERGTELMAALYELEVVGPADADGNHEVRWTEKEIAESKNAGADAIPEGGAAAEIE
jgi:hypothetical protein